MKNAKRKPVSTLEVWSKHFGDAAAVSLDDTEAFWEELNDVCKNEDLTASGEFCNCGGMHYPEEHDLSKSE